MNVALLLSPAKTKPLSATPPVLLANDHVFVTFATKFPFESRLMAYAVSEFPAVTFCAGTTVPLPLTAVSTCTVVAAPGTTGERARLYRRSTHPTSSTGFSADLERGPGERRTLVVT